MQVQKKENNINIKRERENKTMLEFLIVRLKNGLKTEMSMKWVKEWSTESIGVDRAKEVCGSVRKEREGTQTASGKMIWLKLQWREGLSGWIC